jgi:hypothetical protein
VSWESVYLYIETQTCRINKEDSQPGRTKPTEKMAETLLHSRGAIQVLEEALEKSRQADAGPVETGSIRSVPA